MANRTYTIRANDQEVRITSDQLAAFRHMLIGNSPLASRMSKLIWLDIYTLDHLFGVSAQEILWVIQQLENGDRDKGTKPATQFRYMPLKGLWHKHYFSARFLPKNICLSLGEDGVERLAFEVLDPSKSPIFTREMIEELARRIAEEPFEKRYEQKRLTGEWIIFLKRDDGNYYLCCGTHKDGDQYIYDRIVQNCIRDFPNLLDWIKEAQTSVP
jgi:hypothetical protein